MTTPVLSTAGQQRERGNRMAFVMESKYGTSLQSLPVPQDSRSVLLPSVFQIHPARRLSESDDCDSVLPHRVTTKEQESCVMAALSFGGLPLDFQVCLLGIPIYFSGGKSWHLCQFCHNWHRLAFAFKSEKLDALSLKVPGVLFYLR